MTIDELKKALPSDLLVVLTDDYNAGTIDDSVLQNIIDRANSHLEALGITDDALILKYASVELYGRYGFKEQAKLFHDQLVDYLKLKNGNSRLSEKVEMLSSDRILSKAELEKWI